MQAIGTRHALSYGGNFRHNSFDISLAPDSEDRNEGGAYIQDEIFLSDRFRWVVGGRIDKFSSIDNAVFSPRTTLMYKPSANQTFRVSFNRAFRAPSLINNHLDVTILTPVTLPVVGLFAFPTRAVGNPDLEQETLTAFEIGYSGVIAPTDDVSRRRCTGTIPTARSRSRRRGLLVRQRRRRGGRCLRHSCRRMRCRPQFTYLNLGTIKDKGIELGVDTGGQPHLNVFVNYSYQWMPEIEDFPAGTTINDVNWPAKNRFNAGFNFNYGRFLGNFVGELHRRGVLAGRARCALCRNDRGVHAGERGRRLRWLARRS